MDHKKIFQIKACIFMSCLMFAASSAYGYIDPGTGSYLFQIIIAFFIAAAFSIKMFWKKIAAFFRKIFSGKTDAGPHAS